MNDFGVLVATDGDVQLYEAQDDFDNKVANPLVLTVIDGKVVGELVPLFVRMKFGVFDLTNEYLEAYGNGNNN